MEKEAPVRPKRKRSVLTFRQKLDILQQLEQGVSGGVVAKQYGIASSTLSDIKRSSAAILKFVSKMESDDERMALRKTRKTGRNVELEISLSNWYQERKNEGIHVTGPEFCKMALTMNRRLNGDPNFKASNGWLRHFKMRHGIYDRDNFEVEASSQEVTKKLKSLIKREAIELDDIYNVDECVLNWKSLPKSTRDNEQITLVVCVNATGTHKLPLMIIGRAKGKFLNRNFDKFIYKTQINAWMDLSIFVDWYESIFVPEVLKKHSAEGVASKGNKALLIMDSAPSHPYGNSIIKESLAKFKVFYLPTNVTLTLQPMDQGIKSELKGWYRRGFLRRIAEDTSSQGVKKCIENFSIVKAAMVLVESWNSIKPSSISHKWNRILCITSDHSDINGDSILDHVEGLISSIHGLDHLTREDIAQWLASDLEDPEYLPEEGLRQSEACDDDSISEEDQNTASDNDDAASCEYEDTKVVDCKTEYRFSPDPNVPSHSEALYALETTIRWCEAQEDVSQEQLANLRSLRDLAAIKVEMPVIKRESL